MHGPRRQKHTTVTPFNAPLLLHPALLQPTATNCPPLWPHPGRPSGRGTSLHAALSPALAACLTCRSQTAARQAGWAAALAATPAVPAVPAAAARLLSSRTPHRCSASLERSPPHCCCRRSAPCCCCSRPLLRWRGRLLFGCCHRPEARQPRCCYCCRLRCAAQQRRWHLAG